MLVKLSTSPSTETNSWFKAFLLELDLWDLAFLSALVILRLTPASFFLSSLRTVLYGFSLAMALLFLNGLGLVPLVRLAWAWAGLTTLWIASELIKPDKSALLTTSCCNLYPFFVEAVPLPEPKCLSKELKAD